MKEIIQYIEDDFTDNNGCQRKFIICAVTISNSSGKFTRFGISVARKEDMAKYSLELGKKIAYGKACKRPFIFVECNRVEGMNQEICNAYLKTFAKYFKEDPSFVLTWFKSPRNNKR